MLVVPLTVLGAPAARREGWFRLTAGSLPPDVRWAMGYPARVGPGRERLFLAWPYPDGDVGRFFWVGRYAAAAAADGRAVVAVRWWSTRWTDDPFRVFLASRFLSPVPRAS